MAMMKYHDGSGELALPSWWWDSPPDDEDERPTGYRPSARELATTNAQIAGYHAFYGR